MRVSFVIPAHNEAALIARTLDAMHAAADEVIGPGGAGEYEVIVVDDSSTDATGAIAASYAPRGTRVIRVEHRQISRTRASGARAALGDLFIFVDADTLINPAVLRAALAAIQHGAIGGGAAMRFDGRIPLWARVSVEMTVQLFRIFGFTGGCFLYCTRAAYHASGGWDETLFASEEICMCKALKAQGRFVVLRQRVTTSGRKIRTHSVWEILSLIFKYSIRGQKILRDRQHLDLWYGERRDDPPPFPLYPHPRRPGLPRSPPRILRQYTCHPMRLPRDTANYAVLAVLLTALLLFLVYPIILTISGAVTRETPTGVRFTFDHLLLVFQDPTLRQGVLNAFKLAACTTALAIFIALPLAICSARYKFPLKPVFSALILVPLILPPFVGAIGVQMILGREGALNALLGTDFDILGRASFWGIVAVQALSLYPIIFLNATAALANLDPALDEAAQNLGAGPVRRFFRITLPLIRPGIFAGATIVFIWSFTELGTPLVFDYRELTSVQIFNGLKEVETSPQPYALTLVLLVAAIGCYLLGKWVFGGKAYAMYSKASRASAEHRLSLPAGLAVTGAFALVTALALLPHIGVVLTAFSGTGAWYRSVIPTSFTTHNFETALADREAFGSIVNSLKLASAAMVVDLVVGLLIGYIIVRTRIRGRGLLDALSMLPLAVPGLVMAFGYVAMTLRWPFGRGDPLEGVVSVVGATPNPVLLLVIAYAVRRLPYMVRATVAGLQQTSGELEEAAMNLGASRVYAVRKVIVPLIAANLIAGCLLAFSFAMLEVSDSLLLAQQQQHYPITKAILSMLNRLGDGPHIASAMGVWGMALLTVTLVGASVLIGKKLGSIFRV